MNVIDLPLDITEVANTQFPGIEGLPTTSTVGDDEAPYRCVVCSTPLTYGGKGRPPTRCDEHKRQLTGGTRRTSDSTKGGKVSLRVIEEQIADLYKHAGLLMMLKWPDDAMEIVNHSDKMAHSWIVYAEANPKFRKYLEKMVDSVGVGTILIAHLPVIMAIAANHDYFRKPKDTNIVHG